MVTWSQPLWASEDSSEPWPVSKYMTLGPVQVPRDSMVARPSSSMAAFRPKASLPFWEPAMDWNIRSRGAPNLLAASVWVVTWASTQIWVGTSHLRLNSSNIFRMRATLSTESSTGFRPMTASPQPRDRPSITDAMMPLGSSVVWLGCRREEKVPGRPMVVLQWAVTRIFLAA